MFTKSFGTDPHRGGADRRQPDGAVPREEPAAAHRARAGSRPRPQGRPGAGAGHGGQLGAVGNDGRGHQGAHRVPDVRRRDRVPRRPAEGPDRRHQAAAAVPDQRDQRAAAARALRRPRGRRRAPGSPGVPAEGDSRGRQDPRQPGEGGRGRGGQRPAATAVRRVPRRPGQRHRHRVLPGLLRQAHRRVRRLRQLHRPAARDHPDLPDLPGANPARPAQLPHRGGCSGREREGPGGVLLAEERMGSGAADTVHQRQRAIVAREVITVRLTAAAAADRASVLAIRQKISDQLSNGIAADDVHQEFQRRSAHPAQAARSPGAVRLCWGHPAAERELLFEVPRPPIPVHRRRRSLAHLRRRRTR